MGRQRAERAIRSLDDSEVEALLYDWRFVAREEQLPPPGDWTFWMYLAGRGAGKTRSGAEFVRGLVKGGCRRIALVAPTAADARDVMVEGESGLLSVCWKHDRDLHDRVVGVPDYEPSKRRLTWENGAIATTYSADEPERLRGPQHDGLWADELAAWRYMTDAWDMAELGLRLGRHPRGFISTTPKPKPLVRQLSKDPDCVVTAGTTYDNIGNLAPTFIRRVVKRYEGTTLGRQELLAHLMDESSEALWKRAWLDRDRVGEAPEMEQEVVAIDPAASNTEYSSETGVVGVGKVGNHVYVTEDRSGKYTPEGWAREALTMWQERRANWIVAEKNNGGDMVRFTIKATAKEMKRAGQLETDAVPIKLVWASKGKMPRAEPVSALYELRQVHHVGTHEKLEDQLCTWEPLSGDRSPDRLDALVWGVTSLAVTPGSGVGWAPDGSTRQSPWRPDS